MAKIKVAFVNAGHKSNIQEGISQLLDELPRSQNMPILNEKSYSNSLACLESIRAEVIWKQANIFLHQIMENSLLACSMTQSSNTATF